jgi:membrane-anchored glycerophosphoryl diester phosphodiesterase (GDPDase)
MEQQPATSPSVVETRAPALLGEQTAGRLIRNIWRVYRKHFVRIWLAFVLPIYPLLLAATIAPDTWGVLFIYPFAVTAFVSFGALTITMSDICLGISPSTRRSYARVFQGRTWLKLLTTALLASLLCTLGLLLLFVGYIWVGIRLIFSPAIVMLEGRANRDAIRRSFQLTRSQFWRLFGLTTLAYLVTTLAMAVPLALVSAIGNDKAYNALAGLLYLGLLFPALGIAVVLLYYDQRVRRESYDADALSEDLMR